MAVITLVETTRWAVRYCLHRVVAERGERTQWIDW